MIGQCKLCLTAGVELQDRHFLSVGIYRILTTAADQYIVSRGDQKSVIAGYHWFGDWGRDTIRATRSHASHRTLRYRAKHSAHLSQNVDKGMLPNRFPDAGQAPEYNTVDATLWFFEAVRAYHAYTGDLAFVQQELYPVLTDIINWHVRDTRYGIKLDAAGLINSGEQGVQLTWMDAKVGDWVVTPRRRKPVQTLAAQFKRPYRNCPTTQTCHPRTSASGQSR